MVLEPLERRVTIRRVDDQQVAAGLQPIRDQVVDDPAVLVGQERVLGASRLDLVEVVGEQALEQLVRPGPFDLELAHVRHVENAGVRPDGAVLGDHAFVLDGHLPPRERNHARVQGQMPLVERRSTERLHDARMLQRL